MPSELLNDELHLEYRTAHQDFLSKSKRLMCLVLETAHLSDDEVADKIRDQREAVNAARERYLEVRRRYFRTAFPDLTMQAAGAGGLLHGQ